MTVQVPCYAKINTFLAVGPADTRGYHPLRTVFQAISLQDTLTITETDGPPEITCDLPGLPSENTLTKTLRLLAEIARVPNLKLHLQKQIPTESGLGGGSSNAAGLLRGIQHFLPGKLSDSTLMDIAQAVGADVPFFLVGGRAKGEGYGEQLTALPDPPPEWLVIAKPDVSCPTKEAFRKLDTMQFTWQEFPEDLAKTHNDFERSAPQASLDLIRQLRVYGANRSGLTGSGSAIFGFFDSQNAAEQASANLRGAPVPNTQHAIHSTQHPAPNTQDEILRTQHAAPSTQHLAPSTRVAKTISRAESLSVEFVE